MKTYITQYSALHGQAPSLQQVAFRGEEITVPVFRLSTDAASRVQTFLDGHPAATSSKLDFVTTLALTAAQEVKNKVENPMSFTDIVVIAASARGATGVLESTTKEYYTSQKISSLTSPLTTAGGIASTVSHLVSPRSLALGTSMTCASFLEALLMAQGLLTSGFASRALVIGAEAPLTPYTIAQMLALKIYNREIQDNFPCKPFSSITENRNQLVLGEGAAAFLLESEASIDKTKNTPLAQLCAIGFCQEHDESLTGMNREGEGFLTSMQRTACGDPALIIAHAPGTVTGDLSERNALESLYKNLPPIISTKFFTGHTFGASAGISLAFALSTIRSGDRCDIPFDGFMKDSCTNDAVFKRSSQFLVNAAGFGGVVMSASFELL